MDATPRRHQYVKIVPWVLIFERLFYDKMTACTCIIISRYKLRLDYTLLFANHLLRGLMNGCPLNLARQSRTGVRIRLVAIHFWS